MQDVDDEDEDNKWIEEQTKILNIRSNYPRESLSYIHLHLCYVDCNNTIVDLKTLKHLFKEHEDTLTQEEILKIIDNNKRLSNMSFAFSELAMFHVDVEPENVNSFDPHKSPFFKIIPLISDIHFSKSIFIFHTINCLFFLFKQKSSLKQPDSKKSMKKVAFSSKKQTRRIV